MQAMIEKLNFDTITSWGNNAFSALKNVDLNSVGVRLLILIFCVLILSFVIDYLLSRTIFGRNYRVFVAPGVIFHEFSHATLCLLTGAKIKKISLFDKEGGSVEHEASKIPVIGQMLISLAPFIFGVAAIYFMSQWLGLKNIDVSSSKLSADGILSSLKGAVQSINFSDYHNWIIIYLVLSIAVTLTPSWQDLANIASSTLLVALILFLILHSGKISTDWLSQPVEKMIALLSTVIFLLLLALLFSIITFGISKLISRN